MLSQSFIFVSQVTTGHFHFLSFPSISFHSFDSVWYPLISFRFLPFHFISISFHFIHFLSFPFISIHLQSFPFISFDIHSFPFISMLANQSANGWLASWPTAAGWLTGCCWLVGGLLLPGWLLLAGCLAADSLAGWLTEYTKMHNSVDFC